MKLWMQEMQLSARNLHQAHACALQLTRISLLSSPSGELVAGPGTRASSRSALQLMILFVSFFLPIHT